MNTNLKPLEVDTIINNTILDTMAGNAGLAIVRLKKQFTGYSNTDVKVLNDTLTSIELEARKRMRTAIEAFIILN